MKFQSNLNLMSFYAQDTYTRARLTLQGGVRYDGISTFYPDTAVGGPDYQLMPTQVSFPAGSTDTINWKDVTPRLGAAYDLFGNGKTAIKLNLGKYLTARDREQQRHRSAAGAPHRDQHDADVE